MRRKGKDKKRFQDAPNEGLPEAFLERLARIIPADRLPSVLAALAGSTGTGFRINGLVEQVVPLPEAGQVLPWFNAGYVVPAESRQAVLESAAAASGQIWIQNPSSMIPPVVLDPQPGDRVLDLAAAPGSKTLQLAGILGEGADIAAVELVRNRFYRLKRNLSGHGAAFVKTFNRDGMKVWRYRPDYFDRVLIDAPCSTEGQMRPDDPGSYSHWSVRKVRTMAGKQRRLLESAIRCARPGGVVVYSTCSFAPEENEAVVQHALDVFEEAVRVEPIDLAVPSRTATLPGWEERDYHPSISQAMRVLPDGVYEAFFVCKLRRLA